MFSTTFVPLISFHPAACCSSSRWVELVAAQQRASVLLYSHPITHQPGLGAALYQHVGWVADVLLIGHSGLPFQWEVVVIHLLMEDGIPLEGLWTWQEHG